MRRQKLFQRAEGRLGRPTLTGALVPPWASKLQIAEGGSKAQRMSFGTVKNGGVDADFRVSYASWATQGEAYANASNARVCGCWKEVRHPPRAYHRSCCGQSTGGRYRSEPG